MCDRDQKWSKLDGDVNTQLISEFKRRFSNYIEENVSINKNNNVRMSERSLDRLTRKLLRTAQEGTQGWSSLTKTFCDEPSQWYLLELADRILALMSCPNVVRDTNDFFLTLALQSVTDPREANRRLSGFYEIWKNCDFEIRVKSFQIAAGTRRFATKSAGEIIDAWISKMNDRSER